MNTEEKYIIISKAGTALKFLSNVVSLAESEDCFLELNDTDIINLAEFLNDAIDELTNAIIDEETKTVMCFSKLKTIGRCIEDRIYDSEKYPMQRITELADLVGIAKTYQKQLEEIFE